MVGMDMMFIASPRLIRQDRRGETHVGGHNQA